MKKFLNVFFIFISFLLCFSCSNFSLSEKSAIKITLPAAERAVSSTQPMIFVLTAIPENSTEEITAQGKSGETIILDVEAGTYTVNLKAYAEEDTEKETVLFEGIEEKVAVIANQTTELKLKLKRQIFTVTLISDDKKATVELSNNSLLTISKTPEKEGYTLLGWYTDDDKEFDFTTPITSDLTLTAKWKINSYTVTFVAEETTTQTVNYGEKAVKPEDPTKKGATFLGWYAGDDEYDFETAVKADVTLTAKWQDKISSSISVVFDSVQDGEPYFEYETDENLVVTLKTDSKIEYKSYTWLINGVIQKETSNTITIDIATLLGDTLNNYEKSLTISCIAYTDTEADNYCAKLVF